MRKAAAKRARAERGDPDDLEDARVLIVEGRYYDHIADLLLAGARRVLSDARVAVDIVTVPGALEIPAAIAIALGAAEANGRAFDGVVALGCVIRGETSHYDIVAGESARALMDLAVERRLPVGNGILTVDKEAQALERAGKRDKGANAAKAALALIRHKRRMEAS